MTKFALAAFKYFKSHKVILWVILLVSTVVFAWFGSRVRLEEDITSLLPPVENGGAEKMVFSNLQVKDKVFVLFQGTSDDLWPEDLIAVCDEFTEALLSADSAYHTIHSVSTQIPPDVIEGGIGFLYRNAPTFVDESKYRLIDSLLDESVMREQMRENYQMLTSSTGSNFKELVMSDPVGLRKMFMSDLPIGNNSADDEDDIPSGYTIYDSHIMSADHSLAIAFITPNSASFDSGSNTRLANLLESEISQFGETYPDVRILSHGLPLQSVNNSRQIKADLFFTVLISLAIIITILMVCFRNFSTIPYLICPVLYGVLFAMAMMYFIKGSMSLMALGIGAIVMGVAFSYCLHVITHYKYLDDPEKVIKDQTKPLLMGMITTVGAFMGLLLTKSALLQDFGLFATFGIFGTAVFCLLFLPQFFNLKKNRHSRKAFEVIEKVNSYPYERKRWLIITLVVVCAVCIFYSRKVQFDSNLQNIGFYSPELIESQKLLEEKTSGKTSTYYFAVTGGDLDTAFKNNAHMAEKLEAAKNDGLIESYTSTSQVFVPTDVQKERVAGWNAYWTPEKKAEVRQKLTKIGAEYKFSPETFEPFFAMLDAQYTPVSLYDSGIIPDELKADLIEKHDDSYIVFTPVKMDSDMLFKVGHIVTDGESDMIVVAPMFYTENMVSMIHDDFNTALSVSSIFVLIILLLSYRHLLLALIAFVPMSLSWYVVQGFMAMFGVEFNLINIVISTFIFGVGVDYSIYIMDGLIGKYRSGYQPLLKYHKTAILLSALILIIVLGALTFAKHPAIASIGISSLIGMTSTIILSYSLQPFLFEWMTRWRTKRGKTAVPNSWFGN